MEAFNSGNAYRESALIVEAIEAYRRAIEYQDNFAAAIYNLGLSLGELERWDEALKLLDSLHQKDPENLMVLRSLGRMSLQSGNSEKAVHYYRLALDVFEADQDSLRALAGIQEELGNFESALVYWRMLLYLNDDTESLSAIARNLSALGNNADALEQYSEILIREPGSIEALRERARISEKIGLYSESFSAYLELSEVDIERAGIAFWRAASIALVKLEEYQQGMEILKQALDAGFSNDEAFNNLLRSAPEAIRPSLRQQLIFE